MPVGAELDRQGRQAGEFAVAAKAGNEHVYQPASGQKVRVGEKIAWPEPLVTASVCALTQAQTRGGDKTCYSDSRPDVRSTALPGLGGNHSGLRETSDLSGGESGFAQNFGIVLADPGRLAL